MKQEKETGKMQEERKWYNYIERSTAGAEKSPYGLTIAWAYPPHGFAAARNSESKPNEPNLFIEFIHIPPEW